MMVFTLIQIVSLRAVIKLLSFVFTNKTAQNMKNMTKLTLVLKCVQTMMSCCVPSRLAFQLFITMSGHRSEASLRNYTVRPSSELLGNLFWYSFDALNGRPHQSQEPSFTALLQYPEQYFTFISFIHKTHALSSLFSDCHVKNLRVFIGHAKFDRILTWHFVFISLSKLKKNYMQKVVNSTRQTSYVWELSAYCELWWFVKFEVCEVSWFDNFDKCGILQPILFLKNLFKKDSDWLMLACFMRVKNCWEPFCLRRKSKFVSLRKSNARGIWRILWYDKSK